MLYVSFFFRSISSLTSSMQDLRTFSSSFFCSNSWDNKVLMLKVFFFSRSSIFLSYSISCSYFTTFWRASCEAPKPIRDPCLDPIEWIEGSDYLTMGSIFDMKFDAAAFTFGRWFIWYSSFSSFDDWFFWRASYSRISAFSFRSFNFYVSFLPSFFS